MVEAVKIAIVEDDWAMREAIKTLVETAGLCAEGFSSAQEFLSSQHAQDLQCLILDVRMPGMSGFELQRRLAKDNCRIPIIFITAHYTEIERARAIEAGAVDFLHKPFSEQALFDAIQAALLTYRKSTALVVHDSPIILKKESDMKTSNGYDEAKERSQGESPGVAARSESEQPIRFANSVLGKKRHICAFFNSPDMEYQVLLPVIKEGFERGTKASRCWGS